jgi:uncharacterized DUF497 family protein
MKFELDPQKSGENLKKHGISLEEAKELWLVPAVEIEARTVDEPRWMAIGMIRGKIYSCIYTKRGETIRLISARRSRSEEEAIYHEAIKRSQSEGQ